MIFLAIITAAVIQGTAPPVVFATFQAEEHCEKARVKLERDNAELLRSKGQALVCLKIVYPV